MPMYYQKVFILCAVIGAVILFIYLILEDRSSLRQSSTLTVKSTELKYILQWTRPDTQPFIFMGVGQKGFIDRKCEYNNCVVTSDRQLLNNLTEYDVILFHGPELVYVPILNKDFPKIRSPQQKYVFASIESSQYYPICSNRLDGFFNWTWTYRLDSDAIWGYVLVKDKNNVVVGPSRTMHWIEAKDMEPVSKEFRGKIKTKNKAAAWFVSNCNDKSGRIKFAHKLQTELRKFHLDLDIFGKCGTKKCKDETDCDKMISDTYYFYLAFENSFNEDYVTEKLLRALKNDAVPVVFGGANYSRFLPDGSYLNARELGVELLASTMNNTIADPEQYLSFFKWRNHYSYHSRDESPESNDYCHFCAMINDEKTMKTVTTIDKFREWWDPPSACH